LAFEQFGVVGNILVIEVLLGWGKLFYLKNLAAGEEYLCIIVIFTEILTVI